MLKRKFNNKPLSLLSNDHHMDAYVVFMDNPDQHWFIKLFTRPGFRHCRVYVAHDIPNTNSTVFIAVDGGWDRLGVDIAYDISDITALGETVIRVNKSIQPKPMHNYFYSCVETVKKVLGIRGHTVFTPWLLFKHLSKRDDAIVVKGD